MEQPFEMQLTDLQAEMVAVCLDYCHDRCEQVYIHVINEHNTLFVDFFFRIDGKVIRKSKISQEEAVIHPDRQQAALSELLRGARAIFSLCDRNDQPQPTEMKLVYHTEQDELEADLGYDEVTGEHSDRAVSQQWFDSLGS